MPVLRRHVLSFFQLLCQDCLLFLFHIDLIEGAARQHIEPVLSGAVVDEPAQLILRHGRGFITGDERLLVHVVLLRRIVVDGGAHLAFVGTPVHVAADREGDIAAVVHGDQPDHMLSRKIPDILPLRAAETEQERDLIPVLVVIPQFICLDKGYTGPVAADKIGHIRIRDAKKDPLLTHHRMVGIKDLLHRPVVIEKIHGAGCIPHPEELPHRVQILLVLLPGAQHLILEKHGCVRAVGLCDRPPLRPLDLGRKIPPGHMVVVRVDGQMVKAGLLAGRLQRCAYAYVLHLAHGVRMVIGNVLQALGQGKLRAVGDPRIVADLLPVHVQGQKKKPLLRQKAAVKRQDLRLLRILHRLRRQLLPAVQGAHRVLQRADLRVIGLDMEFQLLVLHRRDAVPHGRGVHVPGIPLQVVYGIPLADKRQGGKRGAPQICRHIVISSVCEIAEHKDRHDEHGGQNARMDQASLHLSSSSLPSVESTCRASSQALSFPAASSFFSPFPVFTARIRMFLGVCSMSINSRIWVS